MRSKSILFTPLVLALACSGPKPESIDSKNWAELVNPFIGTGGHGHTYPGVSAPFGFMQLSPDTRLSGWDGCGGYHYSDSVIYGFSHTHLSGTGISDYGDVLIMPFSGEGHFQNGSESSINSGYASRFSHSKESAHAGYYQVELLDYNIQVELSASQRAGMHHYQYPESASQGLVIDLQHRDQLLDAHLEVIDPSHIRGYRISKAWAQEQHLYFYLELSQTIKESRYDEDSTKLLLYFDNPEELYLKIGSSAVSMEGAEKNLKQEIPDWDFKALRQNCEAAWNKELSKIQALFESPEDEKIFYTALYHSYLNPNIFQDVDGQYRGTDLEVHQDSNFTNYTVFSLWDTYRATHPLFTLTQQERSLDFIETFLHQYQNGGELPMWELAGNYTGCMIGYHAIPVIVDAYAKGIRDFDTELALKAMIEEAEKDELGKAYYIAQGYMASNDEHESVSKNLEYAYNDWCIAQFAKELGKDSIYRVFIERAQNYKNIFDPETGFMRAKRKQMFMEPFDPAEVNFNFTEANSWQYSFYVPQDLSGLIALQGGADGFNAKLDALFNAPQETSGREQADITGLIGQYAHGNEPSHHMAYLYNYTGASAKTQAMVRRIMKEMYHNSPDGLIGNEDCGQMSSWYVLSALGFYPVTPGSPDYIIGSPLVKNASLELENGRNFKIKVENQGPENVYIQEIRLNGNPYTQAWISQKSILDSGELTFVMGPKPGPKLEAPVSEIKDELISPVPFIKQENAEFRDSLVLSLHCTDPDAKIYYSLRGNQVDTNSTLYEKPIVLKDNSLLYAMAKAPGKKASKLAGTVFVKLKTNRKIEFSTPTDPQYPGSGSNTLLDGMDGGDDFRTGGWQGWQGQDVELIIDLGPEGEHISRLSTNLLQDTKSWIFLPKQVRFYAAQFDDQFEFLGAVQPETTDTASGTHIEDIELSFSGRRARKVKIVIENYGPLPTGHISAGKESWLFMDEVKIRKF